MHALHFVGFVPFVSSVNNKKNSAVKCMNSVSSKNDVAFIKSVVAL